MASSSQVTIASVEIFRDLSKAELRKIERLMTPLEVNAGTVLIREGSPGREAFIVLEGTASVRRDGKLIATVGPGDVLGEMSVISGTKRTATVTAETNMYVEVLNKREFTSLLDESPRLTKKIMVGVLKRLQELEPGVIG